METVWLYFPLSARNMPIHEKEIYSRIIKNLCESQGVFLKLASEMMPFDFDEVEKDESQMKASHFECFQQ